MMAVFSAISAGLGALAGALGGATGLAAAAGVAGLAATGVGAVVQASAAGKAAKASARAEDLRKAQVALEADRSRRQILRQAMLARGLALTNATAQGAAGGSGLQGGLGQIMTGAAENVGAVDQSQGISSGIFDANKQVASAQAMGSIGQGLSSIGGAMIVNQEAIGRIGTYYGSRG